MSNQGRPSRRFVASRWAERLVPLVLILLSLALAVIILLIVLSVLGLIPA